MDPERLGRIVDSVSSPPDGRLLQRLCRVCADELEVGGAGITLFVDELPWGPWAASNRRAAEIEGLQLMFGEGPCVDAHRTAQPVVEPDLAEPIAPRWPGFAPAALTTGAAAVFAFPLRQGAARLGALTLHRPTPGPLTPDRYDDGLAMAEVATSAILALQARSTVQGEETDLDLLADYRASLHQAAGMVSVQLGLPIIDATVRLRAHAYVTGRRVSEVSDDIVARRLRFDPEEPPRGPDPRPHDADEGTDLE